MRNRRLDGVGEWVLQKNEFESWRKSQDGLGSPTLVCYGDQGRKDVYKVQGYFLETCRRC